VEESGRGGRRWGGGGGGEGEAEGGGGGGVGRGRWVGERWGGGGESREVGKGGGGGGVKEREGGEAGGRGDRKGEERVVGGGWGGGVGRLAKEEGVSFRSDPSKSLHVGRLIRAPKLGKDSLNCLGDLLRGKGSRSD